MPKTSKHVFTHVNTQDYMSAYSYLPCYYYFFLIFQILFSTELRPETQAHATSRHQNTLDWSGGVEISVRLSVQYRKSVHCWKLLWTQKVDLLNLSHLHLQGVPIIVEGTILG